MKGEEKREKTLLSYWLLLVPHPPRELGTAVEPKAWRQFVGSRIYSNARPADRETEE